VTIRPGEEWGVPVDRPADLQLCSSDADFVRSATSGAKPLAVTAGDLHRSVGAATIRATMQRVEVDALDVTVDDGSLHRAVAHVVMRNRWAVGPVVMVMNVDHLGEWYVAPRAHPNDGRFDVCEVASSMSIRQRWSARSRLASGTHLPHPEITTGTDREREWGFDRPTGVWVDGVHVGSARRVVVRIEPDEFALYI
jgi:diacylglycerol kinase family enzyme